MNILVTILRLLLLFFIWISIVVAAALLSLDIDLMLNGPKTLAKVLSMIINRFRNDENLIDPEYLEDMMTELNQSFWVQMLLLMVLVLAILILSINLFGCAGSCLVSYPLLSGFSMFMFVTFALFLSIALWVFTNKLDDDLFVAFVNEKIKEYRNGTNSFFNVIIDTVQQDLECCGFKSALDWQDDHLLNNTFPKSCCSNFEPECIRQKVFEKNCLEEIGNNLFEPLTLVGFFGNVYLMIVVVTGATFIVACGLCLAAGRKRDKLNSGDPRYYDTTVVYRS